MSALVASFLLIGYLLAPGVIYRLLFSFEIPAKRYQRTRTEEVVFSILVTVLPFLLALVLLWYTGLGHLPEFSTGSSKAEAYRTVFRSLLPGPELTPRNPLQARISLSDAYLRAFMEQARFLGLLWALCGLEGWICARIVAGYGDYDPEKRFDRWRKWFCDEVLLTYVSEWEVLFSTLALPKRLKGCEVHVDALANDVLYRGRLVDWFDADGKLEGIFLEHAARYNKDELIRDLEKGITKPKASYWRDIPGAKLYLVASTIANYNIRYVPPPGEEGEELTHGGVPASAEMTLAQLRARLGGNTVFTPLPPESDPDNEVESF